MTYLLADTTALVQKHSGDDWIIEHVSDSKFLHIEPFASIMLPEFPPIQIGGITIDMSITNKVLMMLIVSALLIWILLYAAKSNKKNVVPRGIGNFVEMIMIFVKDDIILPVMGDLGLKFLPFFFTLFLFLTTANLLGLLPYLSTATGNVSVTAAFALITFVITQAQGIKHNGFFGYMKSLIPPGIPVFVLPIMIVVEFLGLLTKPFALCIRLFANMTAGHIVILAFISLIFSLGYAVTPVSILFSLFIYLIEILVALLQAYIFTMLSALFISMAAHPEH